jgi:hypothetical protein
VLDAKNRADLAWVPLFVKTPGQDAGRVDRRNEMQVDLLPTIADVLDVHVPWKLEGRSVFGAPRADSLKRWFDHPLTDDRSTTTQFAAGDWLPTVQRGYVSEVAPGAKVPRDLFAAGKDAALVGRKLSELSVGQPAPSRAVLDPVVDLEVDPATGTVPALVFGALDRPLGIEPSWLVASVNGTIAGSLAVVVNSDDKARFVGMVDDALFTAGATDLRLFTVEGQTLHQVMLAG